ncbi:YebG family protein [Aeromonas diversa]|uniref:YebG family protein n=1 Tax=Aeromonas diversa TaxID=502790 RepID=UPI00346362D0
MAVAIQYVVVRAGVEKMTFTSKKEADAYDKLLDLSDELTVLLEQAPVELAESDRERLAFYLASQREALAALLRGGKGAPGEEKGSKKPLKQVA